MDARQASRTANIQDEWSPAGPGYTATAWTWDYFNYAILGIYREITGADGRQRAQQVG